jgi:hypothetical protein
VAEHFNEYGYGRDAVPTEEVLNAVAIPPTWHTPREPIAVIVRVEWETDGAIWLPGRATRWTREVVYVEFDDTRKRTTGVWVEAADVRRP